MSHNAIMIGINTVLQENPSLLEGFFETHGPNSPQPILLDTKLKIPLEKSFLFYQENQEPWSKPLWIFTGPKHDVEKKNVPQFNLRISHVRRS